MGEQVQTGIIREEHTGRTSQIDNKMQVTQTKTVTSNSNVVNTIICNKCGNNTNPKGSKFCNKCGSKLQNNCSNCGNINPEMLLLVINAFYINLNTQIVCWWNFFFYIGFF